MKTLLQAVSEHRKEQARIKAEKQAEEARAARAIAEKEQRAVARLIAALQPLYDFPLMELQWTARYVAHKSTPTYEYYDFTFTVPEGRGRVELEDFAMWHMDEDRWAFSDTHFEFNTVCVTDLSQLTWRAYQREVYAFFNNLVEALDYVLPDNLGVIDAVYASADEPLPF